MGQVAQQNRSAVAAKSWSVRWQPARLVNGAPVLFRVSAPRRLASLEGKWLDHRVFFSLDGKTRTWYALAGVSLDTKPGVYALKLSGSTTQGKAVSFKRSIAVHRGKYRSIEVQVDSKYTEPSPEQLQKINQDKALKQELFGKVGPEREWSGSFLAPVKAETSDNFGTRRTFNGEVRSLHQGLDYAVPEGTPVSALNRGTVMLARSLYFEGNCVVLDHGQGLLTLYLHLSQIDVKEGDVVKGGQKIGLSGGTGRATGPHLHIAVRWEGVYVDPATLLSLKLP